MGHFIERIFKGIGAVICLIVMVVLAVPALADINKWTTQGREGSTTIALAEAPQRQVYGTVTDEAGNPLEGIEVWRDYPPLQISYPSPNSRLLGTTDVEGRYVADGYFYGDSRIAFRDPSFRYPVTFHENEFAYHEATMMNLPFEGALELDMSLMPSGTIRGTIWLPDDCPSIQSGLTLHLYRKYDSNTPAVPYPFPLSDYQSYSYYEMEFDCTYGAYVLRGVAPGAYILHATYRQEGAMMQIRYHGGPLSSNVVPILVESGAETTGIIISFLSPTSLETTEEPSSRSWPHQYYFPFVSK